MKTRILVAVTVSLLMLSGLIPSAMACTNILVSKGASADGSVMITYSADSGGSLAHLFYLPAADHEEGELVKVETWERHPNPAKVKQVAHTYAVYNLMNEHQLTIGETTNGGREELHNDKEGLLYSELITLALQRCKTAREAVLTMAALAQEYGYRDEGETFSVADPNEVWMMDIIGKGPGTKGAIWVAARVPDGYISAHANMCRITTIPMDDPDNWLYAPDVVDFAVEKGYYDPASGKPFSYREAYHPPQSGLDAGLRGAGLVDLPPQRALPDFRRRLPPRRRGGGGLPPVHQAGREAERPRRDGADARPLRGHALRHDQGPRRGSFASPYRWRDLTWKVDDVKYVWERPISTQQAGFVMVTQSRDWLPDPVGGVYWYTPDDCYTTPFTPFYAGIDRVPRSFAQGDIDRFSWDSAWWVYNIVSNLTYNTYSRIMPEVAEAQKEVEDAIFAMLPAVEETAVKLYEQDPELAKRFLTTYSVSTAEGTLERWKELGTYILTKFNDGYVRTAGEGHGGGRVSRRPGSAGFSRRIPISSECPTGARTPSDPNRSWPARLSRRVSSRGRRSAVGPRGQS